MKENLEVKIYRGENLEEILNLLRGIKFSEENKFVKNSVMSAISAIENSFFPDYIIKVYSNKQLAGTLFAHKKDNLSKTEIYIHLIYVDNKYQNQKCGKRLFEELEKQARKDNYTNITYHARKDNLPMLKLGESLNFIALDDSRNLTSSFFKKISK